MSYLINIKDLIDEHVVESARIEYKKRWNPEKILHTICAFANDFDNWGGGYAIIGIDEENGMPGNVSGLDDEQIDSISKELNRLCNSIEPRYYPIAEAISYKGKNIFVIYAPGGDERPYKCRITLSDKKSDMGYYIRKASNTIRANSSEEKELFRISETVPFDDRANMRANVDDLSKSLITEYLHDVKSSLYEKAQEMPLETLAKNMRLLKGPKECIKPVNVGLMFFNDRPDDFFSYARIDVVDKPDPTGENMTEKLFFGPLGRQLKDALAYIRNYIIKEKVFKKPEQEEAIRVFNYPYQAVEEALSNAVYHKSYQIGEPVTVMITPEKMEITSLPGPDRTITDEDLENKYLVSRINRNRRIGDFLKELRLAEGRNTGVPTIIRAMENNGSPEPVFKTDSERTYFTTILPVNEAFIPGNNISRQETDKTKTRKIENIVKNAETEKSEKDAEKDAEKIKKSETKKELTEIQRRILEHLCENEELSIKELSEFFKAEYSIHRIRYAVRKLIEEEITEFTQPESPRSPTQKIRVKKS